MPIFQLNSKIIRSTRLPWGYSEAKSILPDEYMLYFDGNTAHVDCGNSVWTNHTKQTAVVWFKRDTDQSSSTNHDVSNVLLAKASESDNDNFELGTSGENINLYLDCDDDGGDNTTENIAAGIENDTWYNLVITFDNGMVHLYLNNTNIYSNDWGGKMDSDADPSNFTIGRSLHENAPLNGFVKMVSVFDRVITSSEIESVYNNPYTAIGDEVMLFKMNEGSGDTVYDKSGNGNNGTINDAIWVGLK